MKIERDEFVADGPAGGAIAPQANLDAAGADNLNLGGGAAQGGHDALNLDLGVVHHNIQLIDPNAPAGKMDVLNIGSAVEFVVLKTLVPQADPRCNVISIAEEEGGYVPGVAIVDQHRIGRDLLRFTAINSPEPKDFLNFMTDRLDARVVTKIESPTITIVNPDDTIIETLKEVRLPYRDTEKSIEILFGREFPYNPPMFNPMLKLPYSKVLARQKNFLLKKNLFEKLSPTRDAPKDKDGVLKTGIWDLPAGQHAAAGNLLDKILSYLKPGDIVSKWDKHSAALIKELEGHTSEVDKMIAALCGESAEPRAPQETSTLGLSDLDYDHECGGAAATW